MILNDRELRALLKQGELILEPLEFSLIQPASIDLRLDRSARTWIAGAGEAREIDMRDEALSDRYEEIDVEGGYAIPPRGFVFGQVLEKMTIPETCLGLIEQRSSLVRFGLQVSSSLVNPGYEGRLPLLLVNQTDRPLRIYAGVPICQLVLVHLSGRPDVSYREKPDAKYHGEAIARPSRIAEDAARWGGARSVVPVALEEAIRRKVERTGFSFVQFRRASKFEIHVLCRDSGGRFWPIVASIQAPAEALEPTALDDALFEAATAEIDSFARSHGTP